MSPKYVASIPSLHLLSLQRSPALRDAARGDAPEEESAQTRADVPAGKERNHWYGSGFNVPEVNNYYL